MRAKAGTGLKPPKPEPLVSPADLISPSARAPRARQPGEATGGPGEEVNWCDRSRDGWPSLEEKPREGRGCLRWDIGMVGEGCWTVPAYQDPSFIQTAGDKTLSEPCGIGITPIHPAGRSHSVWGAGLPAPASLPERISASHHLGIRALLTRQGSIRNRVRPHCSTATGGSWRLPEGFGSAQPGTGICSSCSSCGMRVWLKRMWGSTRRSFEGGCWCDMK